MEAKYFLQNKGIKDTLFIDGNWVKGGSSELLDKYKNQIDDDSYDTDEEWIDEDDVRTED